MSFMGNNFVFLWLRFFLFLSMSIYSAQIPHPWVVYYNNLASTEDFAPYDPIVLDGETHPAIQPLLDLKKTVLGYVNIAEVEKSNSWFSDVKSHGLMLEENQDWPGSWSVNIEDSYWKKLLLHQVIPHLLSKGFTGIFLDQVDVALALGKKKAAIDLIVSIRKKFPKIQLMLNRGYEILPQVGHLIDYELAETLYTIYNFQTKQYRIRTEEEYQWQLSQLKGAKAKFPRLLLFSLDYWDPTDSETIEKIYAMELKNGLRPYVTTISLNEIIPAP